jgi:hypothetical protein
VKRRKAKEITEKPAAAADSDPPAVFSNYFLPVDFEDALMIAIANSAVRPKRQAARGRSAARRVR